MARFQTVIKSARFVYSPYTATEMQSFAQVLADSIRTRIQSGQNIYDQSAAGLTAKEVGQFGFAARAAGQDTTSFERRPAQLEMRGLSEAADDTSKEGEKARTTLQRIGVTRCWNAHERAQGVDPTRAR